MNNNDYGMTTGCLMSEEHANRFALGCERVWDISPLAKVLVELRNFVSLRVFRKDRQPSLAFEVSFRD